MASYDDCFPCFIKYFRNEKLTQNDGHRSLAEPGFPGWSSELCTWGSMSIRGLIPLGVRRCILKGQQSSWRGAGWQGAYIFTDTLTPAHQMSAPRFQDTHTHAGIHVRVHTHAHVCTQIHMHTHAHTHVHTQETMQINPKKATPRHPIVKVFNIRNKRVRTGKKKDI